MRVRVVFLLLCGLSVAGVACSLNPQPLPPLTAEDAGGGVPDASLYGGNDAGVDVENPPAPPDAAADAGASQDADASPGDASLEDGGDAADGAPDGDGG